MEIYNIQDTKNKQEPNGKRQIAKVVEVFVPLTLILPLKGRGNYGWIPDSRLKHGTGEPGMTDSGLNR